MGQGRVIRLGKHLSLTVDVLDHHCCVGAGLPSVDVLNGFIEPLAGDIVSGVDPEPVLQILVALTEHAATNMNIFVCGRVLAAQNVYNDAMIDRVRQRSLLAVVDNCVVLQSRHTLVKLCRAVVQQEDSLHLFGHLRHHVGAGLAQGRQHLGSDPLAERSRFRLVAAKDDMVKAGFIDGDNRS